MPRRTKIVATLGPSTDDPQRLTEMIDAGLDVARLNFSHGDHDELAARINLLREVAENRDRDIGIMGDLQGPKIRVRKFENSNVSLANGDSFYLDSSLGECDGNQEGVGVAYDRLHEDVQSGDTLLLNDGQMTLRVDSISGTRIHTTVLQGGVLSNHKGINRKGGGLSASALTDKDREDIRLAAEKQLDFLAGAVLRSP